MLDAGRIARLGMLAVGLGIGAALASIPGTAAADSSTDWLSSFDSLLSGLSAPAADTSSLNLSISMDGVTLMQDGTAHAYSGTGGDIAIANGADTTAYAYGTDNYADVFGTDATGVAGGETAAGATGASDDTTIISGDNDYAFAGGTDGVDDGATIFGNDDTALAGSSAAGTGSYDVSYVEGNDLGTANATGGDHLVDILKFYGDSTSSAAAAAESSSLLTEGTSTADSGNLLTDLLGSFDPATAAADISHLWADLASLL